MKKLIAISVMLVLLTGAAFAQISGDLFVNSTILGGSTAENSDLTMGGSEQGAKWGLTFGEAPGTGRVVYRLHDSSLWGWFAWRPIEMLRIKLGWDRDGEWGRAMINGWGFTAGAKDLVAVGDYSGRIYMGGGQTADGARPQLRDAGRGGAWYPGIGDGDGWSLLISLYPMDGLQINLGLPHLKATDTGNYGDMTGANEFSYQISRLHASLFYNIEDVGQVTLAFVGRGGLGDGKDKTNSIGQIYGSFYLTALDGIRIDLGFNYGLAFTTAADKNTGGRMQIGLGFNMPTVVEGVGFKLRAGADIGGQKDDVDNDMHIMVGILPTFTIAPGFVFYFHAGLGMNMPSGSGDTDMGWFVNPYISRRAGGITFWAGLKVEQATNLGDKPPITWAVPFGFSANY